MPKGATRKEANEKLGELEKRLRQGVYVSRKDMPLFSMVADNWLTSKEPNIKYTTHEQYK